MQVMWLKVDVITQRLILSLTQLFFVPKPSKFLKVLIRELFVRSKSESFHYTLSVLLVCMLPIFNIADFECAENLVTI